MRKTRFVNFYKVICIVTVWLMAIGLGEGTARGATPPAYSIITSRASVTYDSSVYGPQLIETNIVEAVVVPLESLSLTADRQTTAYPGTTVVFRHSLTNTGNAATGYRLNLENGAGLDFCCHNHQMYRDNNSDGAIDGGDVPINNGDVLTLGIGETVDILVTGTLPVNVDPNLTAGLQITATSTIQNIAASNLDRVTSLPRVELALTKSLVTADPQPGNPLTFRIEASNIGYLPPVGMEVTVDGGTQSLILIRDQIPSGTVFQGLSGSCPGTLLYHLISAAVNSFTTTVPADPATIDEVAYGFRVFPAEPVSIDFTVKIDSNTVGIVRNVANIGYGDPVTGAPVRMDSNLVQAILKQNNLTIDYYFDQIFQKIIHVTGLDAPLYVEATAPAFNIDPAVCESLLISITSALTGDTELYTAVETAPDSGVFRISGIPTQAVAAIRGNNVLKTCQNDILTARIVGTTGAAGTATVAVDPCRTVFDSRSNAPLAGVEVTLIDETGASNNGHPGEPALVFRPDGITPVANPALTDHNGHFAFPSFVAGTYRVEVKPGNGYTFPSVVPPASFASVWRIDPAGSLGAAFAIPSGIGGVDFDLPVDPTPVWGLLIDKTAAVATAEIADFITYQVKIHNNTTLKLTNPHLADDLPKGFSYVPQSARLDGATLPEPEGGVGPRLNFTLPDLSVNQSVTLVYRVKVGINASLGEQRNQAQAFADSSRGAVSSDVAGATVKINPGVFAAQAVVIGKVYEDLNHNGIQDNNEPGIPGVRIIMENGTYAVTDGEGKYSLDGLNPGTHVLKVDPTTMPAGAVLANLNNRLLLDPGSSLVPVKEAELIKVDFADAACTPEVLAEVELRRARGEVYGAETSRNVGRQLAAAPVAATDPQQQPASGIIAGEDHPKETPARPTESIRPAGSNTVKPLPPLEDVIPELDNQLDFIGLTDGQVLPAGQVNPRVKGVGGGRLALWVNGREVSEKQVGKKCAIAAKSLEAWEYIGVNLNPGVNELRLAQYDGFGNQRGEKVITLLAPGKLTQIKIKLPEQGAVADGKTAVAVRVELQDDRGLPVTAPTPLTLECSLGRWLVVDQNPSEPGTQIMVEGGAASLPLEPPAESGTAKLKMSCGVIEETADLFFAPYLRPMIAAGVIHGSLTQSLEDGAQTPDFDAGTAFFVKGEMFSKYLVTMSYDSNKDPDTQMFRDLQADRIYPVFGDSSLKGFDAQSTSPLYLRVERDKSYFLYGDFATPGADPNSLGAYSRNLTGVNWHYEPGSNMLNLFASANQQTKVADELPALGTSGPYTLTHVPLVPGSETVKIEVHDRNQPSRILSSTPQMRLSDYEINPETGIIWFKSPVLGFDIDLNPVFIRVDYEIPSGGESGWTAGLNWRYQLSEGIKLGGELVHESNPVQPFELRGLNLDFLLAANSTLSLEAVQTENAGVTGNGERLELNFQRKPWQTKLYATQTDADFLNPSASVAGGEREAGLKSQCQLGENSRILGEIVHREEQSDAVAKDSQSLNWEFSLQENARMELGLRHFWENPVTGSDVADLSTARAKFSYQLPKSSKFGLFGEYETNLNEPEQSVLAVGGNYQFASKGKVYLRHELQSTLPDNYDLTGGQVHNATVLGIDSSYMKDGHWFSEYRARDAFSGREAEAAMGLRNQWSIAPGVRVNTTLERVNVLAGSGANESTAVTGAIEYTTSPDWKWTDRLELRDASQSQSFFNSWGLAYKANPDWTLLARGVFNRTETKGSGGDWDRQQRYQIGAAYRPVAFDQFNLLLKYELRLEEECSTGEDSNRRVNILAADCNYQPWKALTVSTHYALKMVSDTAQGMEADTDAQLLGAKLTYDLGSRFDIGTSGSVMMSDGGNSIRESAGLEFGVIMKKNCRWALGYNFLGYQDRDLSRDYLTERGVYLSFTYKF